MFFVIEQKIGAFEPLTGEKKVVGTHALVFGAPQKKKRYQRFSLEIMISKITACLGVFEKNRNKKKNYQ